MRIFSGKHTVIFVQSPGQSAHGETGNDAMHFMCYTGDNRQPQRRRQARSQVQLKAAALILTLTKPDRVDIQNQLKKGTTLTRIVTGEKTNSMIIRVALFIPHRIPPLFQSELIGLSGSSVRSGQKRLQVQT